ncbi:Ubiquitin-associated and SH3 domain-containing protein B [Dufourea novaeangliae]|uniref:Ubiquitin-associated and SH3 domain-containing protein B n=1 Tax=Dufourea novaeangliae TaxID=178035 RepID=A0A154PPN2_DUFNO|nr:Ubiquitin-associated and SH3 domain-containing protein B [Dufourea novaeangliae]
MATLPPQKNQTPTKMSEQHSTMVQTLLKRGFFKRRVEKALVATGHRGIQLAVDWMVAHLRDPTVETDSQREYVLYACPTGALAEQLLRFWSETKELTWNGAHNYMPHITLVPFFKAPDGSIGELIDALENIVNQDKLRNHIELETYVSPNFMGLFVKETNTDWLENVALRYVNKLAGLGISAEPQLNSFHLTLLYQFPSKLYQQLRLMAEKLTPTASANWELRLYSRDSRIQNVYKVTQAYMSREYDELDLMEGDYISIPEGICSSSSNDYVQGTSWLTGTSGRLPLSHIKRTAESDSWTLHATIPLTGNKNDVIEKEEVPLTRKPPLLLTNDSTDSPDGIPRTNEPVNLHYHFPFGAWIPYCFESNGSYVRRDLNMPKEIPSRNIQDFQNDSPLTTVGEMQASLVGEAMKSSNIKIDIAFTSPSLRCIQTLAHILKGLDSNIPMKVEPGLIEWLAWYPNGVPVWMTSDELIKAGFNIDKSYNPVIKAKELPLKENAAQYYERSYELIKQIIESTTVGNILIVAHAASLTACTRQLTGGEVPPAAEVTRLVQRVPYLACLAAREGLDGWQLHPPPFPPITHTSNTRFDWKVLL